MWREGLVEEKVGSVGRCDVAAARGGEEGERGGAGHCGGGLCGGVDEWGIGCEVLCLFDRVICGIVGMMESWHVENTVMTYLRGENVVLMIQCELDTMSFNTQYYQKQTQQPIDTYEMPYRSILRRVISLYTSEDPDSYFFTFFIVISRRLTSRYRSS